MFGLSRYVHILLILCSVSIILSAILMFFPRILGEDIKKETTSWTQYLDSSSEISNRRLKAQGFTEEQISKMSTLGRWLLSPEGSSPPLIRNIRKDPYLILIWKHGGFLEPRHIRRFTNDKYSPWDNCTVDHCIISYESKDLQKADAVIFHLHLTRGASELPLKTRADQIWIFLTDESPMHTFVYKNQQLSDYNGLFNWSMSYRMDSDVPVPYGRTVKKSVTKTGNFTISERAIKRLKRKLVAIMGSNCVGSNERWKYVEDLKMLLREDLDIYGQCLDGNATVCPGHFRKDCPLLKAYKFYLAFENSNCKEYITEKVFWNGYDKYAVPIIMGAPKKDCDLLLPPHSFLHVNDFANPAALVNYIQYLNRNDDKYFEYHEWRKYYRVINEHGYFGSTSRHYCRICQALHYNRITSKVYEDVESFWNKERDCSV